MKEAGPIREKQAEQGRLSDSGTFPKVVLIDSVSHCNLKCAMCFHKDMTRKRGVMTWDLFTKIIDEIAETDRTVRVWLVFFGEALILKNRKPSIFDMIRYAKGRGLSDVVLNSNANLLDEEAARALIRSGLDAIYIGLDAAFPETYAKIRVGGDFQATVGNVLRLISLKERMSAATPEIFVQFVEMDDNEAEKEEFTRFWNGRGVIVKIRPKVSWAGLVDAPNLSLGEEDRWACYWAMRTMSITDTGKVVTCAVDLDARFVAGDVRESSLKEVWNGSLKRLRNLHERRDFALLPPICRDCRDWQSARAEYHKAE